MMTRALMAFDLWSARYFEKIVPSGSRDPKSEAFLYMKNSVLLGEKVPWLAQAVLIRYLTSTPNDFSSRQAFEYLFARRPNFWRDRAEDARQLLSQFNDLVPIGDKMLALRDKFASQPRWVSPLQKIRTTCRTFLVNASSVQRSTPF